MRLLSEAYIRMLESELAALIRRGLHPVVVAAHPRSGTHLLIDLLRRQFPDMASWKYRGESNSRLYITLDTIPASTSDGDLCDTIRVLGRIRRPLIKTHYLPDLAVGYFADQSRRIEPAWCDLVVRHSQIIYVYRDVRDVLSSLHAFMAGFDPTTRVPFSDFLRQERDGQNRVLRWANHVDEWFKESGVFCVAYEKVVGDTHRTLERLGEFLGVEPLFREPLLPPKMQSVWQSRWNRLFQTQPGSTAILAHGNHSELAEKRGRRCISASDLNYVRQHAAAILDRLGYE